DTNGRVVPGAWKQDFSDAEIRWRLRWQGAVNHSAALFRRSVVLAAGNYGDCMPYEDHDLWLRLSWLAEVANLPDVLVQYRLAPTSVTGGQDRTYDLFADRAAGQNANLLFRGITAEEGVELRLKVAGRSN